MRLTMTRHGEQIAYIRYISATAPALPYLPPSMAVAISHPSGDLCRANRLSCRFVSDELSKILDDKNKGAAA